MNLLHMKYAVEIAKTNSINKAAETLYVGQSALSRAIKELETNLGVILFQRSAKGMFLTPDGEVFVRYATAVLKQVDDIEKMFGEGAVGRRKFSLSAPRTSYVADAFARFSERIPHGTEIDMFYKETNSMRTLKNVLQDDFQLGILRYAENYDGYYKSLMDEKGLDYEQITEFSYVLLVGENSPLAQKDDITADDLKDLIEIAHADPYVPSLPASEVKKEELPNNTSRRIFVFERGSQFELLSRNPETFKWVSPVPENMRKRYGLVQKKCGGNGKVYKDMLIHKKEYVLSDLDKIFIEELIKAKKETIG